MAKTYNYVRYKMSEYDLGKFPGPKAGEPAVDFTLSTPDGKEVKLEDYKGKWVVIETGSITCSMYVKNVGGFAKLRQKYPDVEFLLVYVREAHPGSRLGPHISDKQKRKMSLDMKDIYADPRRVLVDDLNGTMHHLYGALPNMVYVINPEGKVIYRCDWSFPKKVEKVLQNRDQIHTDDHVQIITAAPWIMIPTVLRGGWDALWDIAVAMPMIILAHLRADWENFKKKIFSEEQAKSKRAKTF